MKSYRCMPTLQGIITRRLTAGGACRLPGGVHEAAQLAFRKPGYALKPAGVGRR